MCNEKHAIAAFKFCCCCCCATWYDYWSEGESDSVQSLHA